MAVGKNGAYKIILANGLQKDLIVLSEVQICKIAHKFAKCPFDTDTYAAHSPVEAPFLEAQVHTTERGQDVSR